MIHGALQHQVVNPKSAASARTGASLSSVRFPASTQVRCAPTDEFRIVNALIASTSKLPSSPSFSAMKRADPTGSTHRSACKLRTTMAPWTWFGAFFQSRHAIVRPRHPDVPVVAQWRVWTEKMRQTMSMVPLSCEVLHADLCVDPVGSARFMAEKLGLDGAFRRRSYQRIDNSELVSRCASHLGRSREPNRGQTGPSPCACRRLRIHDLMLQRAVDHSGSRTKNSWATPQRSSSTI